MAQPADAAFLAMEDENIKPPALLRVANILALLGIFVAKQAVDELLDEGAPRGGRLEALDARAGLECRPPLPSSPSESVVARAPSPLASSPPP